MPIFEGRGVIRGAGRRVCNIMDCDNTQHTHHIKAKSQKSSRLIIYMIISQSLFPPPFLLAFFPPGDARMACPGLGGTRRRRNWYDDGPSVVVMMMTCKRAEHADFGASRFGSEEAWPFGPGHKKKGIEDSFERSGPWVRVPGPMT